MNMTTQPLLVRIDYTTSIEGRELAGSVYTRTHAKSRQGLIAALHRVLFRGKPAGVITRISRIVCL